MSLTIETFELGDIYIEYLWDKYAPHYETFVGRKGKDGIVRGIFQKRYATREQAKRSFKRQVAKAQNGDYQ